ncbi:hypothetical protein G9A89_016329 [Geosiphon pyriformis]|nr:hypothetical protein G9A89_016329 [Geosiphon pyriformis]
MTTIRAKSKKTVSDIFLEISNKISTKEAFSVVKAIRQNVLEAFFLPDNRKKLLLVAIETTFLSLAGFSPVKVPSKRHTWISLNVASTPIKSPKVFNNRPVNKLVFLFIALTSSAFSIFSSKKIVKKTKSSEKWEQSLAFAIVTSNSFVVPNEILGEIFIVSSGMSSKMNQNQSLVVLPNMVFSDRLLPVLEAKQLSPMVLPVFKNWTDQIKTELFPSLVSNTATDGA